MTHSQQQFLRCLGEHGLAPVLIDHSARFFALVRYLLRTARDAAFIPNSPDGELSFWTHLALYHDIGKAAVPEATLRKPGSLTPPERARIQSHAAAGGELVRSSAGLWALPEARILCDICRHHHERWDGSGYPDGLRGEELSPLVQLIGMADAYDALVTPRCYRPATPHERAACMLLRGDCGAFSPALRAIFAGHQAEFQTEVFGKTSASA